MKISELKVDQKNPRKHGKRNLDLIEKSLRELGAARSIVIDEENNIIAGNGTVEGAIRAGMEDVQIVDTDGTKLIAVRVSGKTAEEKTRLAVMDNRTAELAEWDEEVLASLRDGKALEGLFSESELEDFKGSAIDETIDVPKSVQLIPPKEYILIMCEANSTEWEELKGRLKLKVVRRGGYRRGSDFDDVGLERVLTLGDFMERMGMK